jgi:hypothetical protein
VTHKHIPLSSLRPTRASFTGAMKKKRTARKVK